jgi:hypothetical protein
MRRIQLTLAMATVFAALPAWAEELPWAAPQSVATAGAVMLAAGDLDGDGDADLVSINEAGNVLTVHLNGVGVSWTTNTIAVTAPSGVALADYDNDGDVDIAVSSLTGLTLDMMINQGDGTSWSQQGLTSAYTGGDVDFADLDNNGGIDVLNSGGTSSRPFIVGFTSAGIYLSSLDTSVGGAAATSIFAGDLSGDAQNDFLLISEDLVSIWTNADTDLSTAALLGTSSTVATLDGARDGELADIDGDGDLDIVVSAQDGTSDTLVWFENNAGTFDGTAQTILASAGGADRISTVDLDQDGDVDVLLSAGTDGDVLFLENTGSGATWAVRTVDSALPGATHAISADLDGDGDLDVVAAGSGTLVWHENQGLHRTASFGGEVAILHLSQVSNPATQRMDFGDFDGDGDLDLVGANSDSGEVHWIENLGGGGTLWSTPTVIAQFLLNARQGVAHDIDQDGDIDAFGVATVGSPYMVEFENDGAANFGPATTIPGASSGLRQVVVGDIDNDGDPDIVRGQHSTGYVTWMRNNGGGTSWTNCTIGDIDTANNIVLADVDADGDLDVITQDNHAPDGSVLFINDGTCGTWSVQATIQGGWEQDGMGDLAAGDIDNDGAPDFITANSSEGLLWYSNPGLPALLSGSWASEVIDASPPGTTGVKVADLDHDGDLDVLAGGGSTVVWYENTGSLGSPWPVQTLSVSAGDGRYVLPVDLSRDGILDVAWGGDDGYGWAPIQHQQAGITGVALSPNCDSGAACIEELDSVAVLRLVVDHTFGRSGDLDVEPGELDLLLEDGSSSPLSDAQAGETYSSVAIWEDTDTSGSFDSGNDTLVVEATTFTLAGGILSLSPPSNASTAVSFGATKTFFVVATIAANGSVNGVSPAGISWIPGDGAIEYAGTDLAVPLDGGPGAAASTFAVTPLDSDNDGDPDSTDCDDGNASVFSGATELCNGIDDDCDNDTDEDFDGDGDFYFDDSNAGCVATYTASGFLDCVDNDSTINPAITEACDGVDEDCTAGIDNGFDNDSDGFFTDSDAGCVTTYGANADCDDAVPSTNSSATEICDGVDQDCDAVIDQTFDLDVDLAYAGTDAGCVATYGAAAVDCDDAVATTNPSATETCNSVDDDCDTVVDDGFDTDSDGAFTDTDPGCVSTYGAAAVDCDDAVTSTNPSATEVCDGVDQDCNTIVDQTFDVDGDLAYTDTDAGCVATYGAAAVDCDDAVASTNPSATETCNNVDDDCDAVIDQTFDVDGDGAYTDTDAGCVATYGAAAVDCDDAVSTTNPSATETCNGVDDDCNTLIDQTFDVDGDLAYTDADAGCVATYGAAAVDCDDAVSTTNPSSAETCNQVDDDCDTVVDDGFDLDADSFFDGDDSGCVAAYAAVDCDDGESTVFPGASESCDLEDSDCDGSIVDEDPDFDADLIPDCVDTDDDADGDPDSSDCDDLDGDIYTGATEACDLVDSDCDGSIVDEDLDTDFDLAPDCVDLDDDDDGMSDQWETANGYDPLDSSDAALDEDSDGRTTLDEFTDGTDPYNYDGPDAPTPLAPADGAWVTTTTPALEISNASSPLGDTLTYAFEMYDDDGLTTLLDSASSIPEGQTTTSWAPADPLVEGTTIWWRAKASDAFVEGPWGATWSFVVDAVGDAPSVPVSLFPVTGTVLPAGSVTVSWEDSFSSDGSAVEYTAQVLDSTGGVLTEVYLDGEDELDTEAWELDISLVSGAVYDWQVMASDPAGRTSDWSAAERFVYDGINAPPSTPTFLFPIDGQLVGDSSPAVQVSASFDPEGGAVRHTLWLDQSPDFTDAIVLPDYLAAEAEVTFALLSEGVNLDDGDWYARVRAEDVNGAVSGVVTIAFGVGLGGDDDDDVVSDDDDSGDGDTSIEPPGFVLSCSQGGTAPPLMLLVVLGMASLLRRRRLAIPLMALMLLPTLASADEATEIAVRSHAFHQQYCADVASGTTTASLEAMTKVVPVLTRLSQVYDRTGTTYLLYWRGLLLYCTGQEERAGDDLRLFLTWAPNEATFPTLWKDAKRRVRRLPAQTRDSTLEAGGPPRIGIGVGGVFELTAGEGVAHPYGGLAIDVTLLSPTVLGGAIVLRAAASGPAREPDGSTSEPVRRSLLPVIGGGAVLRFGERVRPRFLLGFQVGMGNSNSQALGALPGVLAQAGVEFQLGDAPLAIRPGVEVGSLGRFFDLRAGLQLVIGR